MLSQKKIASGVTRTRDQSVKSRVLYRLSYGRRQPKTNPINRLFLVSRFRPGFYLLFDKWLQTLCYKSVTSWSQVIRVKLARAHDWLQFGHGRLGIKNWNGVICAKLLHEIYFVRVRQVETIFYSYRARRRAL